MPGNLRIITTPKGAVIYVDESGTKHYYSQSRRMRLSKHIDLICDIYATTRQDLSVAMGFSTTYLANKCGKSEFSNLGDLSSEKFKQIIDQVDEVVRLSGKAGELTYKRTPKNQDSSVVEQCVAVESSQIYIAPKKPILLTSEDVAEKMKEFFGYSSALWVDGHLVLSEAQ